MVDAELNILEGLTSSSSSGSFIHISIQNLLQLIVHSWQLLGRCHLLALNSTTLLVRPETVSKEAHIIKTRGKKKVQESFPRKQTMGAQHLKAKAIFFFLFLLHLKAISNDGARKTLWVPQLCRINPYFTENKTEKKGKSSV